MDFIIMLEDWEKADAVFQSAGYVRAFKSENVSHYMAKDDALGRRARYPQIMVWRN